MKKLILGLLASILISSQAYAGAIYPPPTLSGVSRQLLVDPRNYGAVCNGAVWSPGTGQPVQQGSDDDTAGFTAAALVAQASGGALLIPDGCWISNYQPISGLHMQGAALGPNYGYDVGTNGQPFARPVLYVIGAPTFGINLNGAETVSFSGFEINAMSNPSAFGNTNCMGSTIGSSGFGGKVWLFNMSFKGCNYGFRPGSPYVYTVSENTDYGANNVGIGGAFSDFYSLGDTFVSNTLGIDLTGGNGGFSRISGARIEYEVNGILIGNNSGIETDIIGTQFDHMSRCGISLVGLWNDVTVTGGGMKAGGLDGSLTVTGAANNGSGLVRLTLTSARPSFGGGTVTGGLVTGDIGNFSGIGGVPGANGTFAITVIDTTHIDLQGSTFSGTYTSGGYGGINNKDANICMSGSTGSKGLHLVNVGFYSSSALGQPPAPAYIIDASTSGSFNDYVDIMGGTLNSINDVVINYNSYTLGIAKWQVSAPPHFRQWANGAPPIMTDSSIFSINATGNVGIGTNNANSGSRLDMGSATDSMILPKGTTAQRPSPVAGMARYNTDTGNIEIYSSIWNALTGNPVIPFYIGGLTLSNDISTPNTVFDTAAGGAASDDNTAVMLLGSAITKTLGSWAVGSGNGCLDTGTVAASTWYHIFQIQRPDTSVVDEICSTSATTPTMPANYTKKRRIGSIKTDGSSNIIGFTQVGALFLWNTATLDVNISNLGTTAALQTLNVPPGINVTPVGKYTISSSSNASVILTSPSVTDVAPTTVLPFGAAPGFSSLDQQEPFGQVNTTLPLLITDTSQRVRARASAASTSLSIVTEGWVD